MAWHIGLAPTVIDLITFYTLCAVPILGTQRIVKTLKTVLLAYLGPPVGLPRELPLYILPGSCSPCTVRYPGWTLNMATNHSHSACFMGGRPAA